MKIDLTGRKAIVTGSTGGIGFAIAKGLAETGAAVVLNGRRQETTQAAAARLAKAVPGAAVRGIAADLGTAAGCAALVAAEPSTDILVNNVGIFGPRDFFATPDEDWEHFLAVNVLSGVRLSRAYLPGMADRGWGRVIFLSSESAINIPADMIHYGVTKTADLALSRGLAKRMAGTGVTVNAILPGPTLSEGVQGDAARHPGENRQADRGGRRRLREGPPAELHHRPHGHRRGGRQPRRLRRLAAVLGDHRRGPQGRWRRGRDDRLSGVQVRIEPVFLFDLDGTLVDSVYQHVLSWKEALDSEGIELSVWRIHRKIGMSGGLFTNQLLRETGLDISAERVARLRRVHAEAYHRYASQIRPLPGARELLSWLTDRNIPWAIATSGRMETAAVNLERPRRRSRPDTGRHARSGQIRQARSRPVPRSRAADLGAHRDGAGGRRQHLGHAGGRPLPGARRRLAVRRLRRGGTAAVGSLPRLRGPPRSAGPYRRGRRAPVRKAGTAFLRFPVGPAIP